MEVSDADIIGASIDEPARFGAIFDRHATALRRYLVRRLGPDTADGMVGEAFRIAFEARHRYDQTHPSARPWLYGIATNLTARHRRTEARRLRATARLAQQWVDTTDHAERLTTDLDSRRSLEAVAEAVAALPPAERDTVILFAWEELSYDDIALALGVPVGTVRSRLNRARTRLREPDRPSGQEPDNRLGRREPGRMGP